MTTAKPDHSTYPALLARVKSGQIKIPQFQRDFVWTKEKSAGLIDSVLKGYPLGTLIFWYTDDRLRSVRDIGGDKLPEPDPGKFVEYVLDGQQRLTSLYAALEGKKVLRDSGVTEDFSEICLSLEAEENDQIVFPDSAELNDGEFIYLHDLIHRGITFYSKFATKYYDKIDKYRDKLNTYSFPITQVSDASLEVATEVFTRINVGGKTLSTYEIMVAKTYDEKLDFDLSEKTTELVERLSSVDYETVPNITILQLIALIVKGECKREAILGVDKSAFIDTWPVAFAAIESAVDHLRSNYGVRASRLLPYNALIIPIALFYYRNSNKPPNSFQGKLLEDFFWRCGIGARYSSGLEGKLAQDSARIAQIVDGTAPKYDWPVSVEPGHLLENGWFTPSRASVKALLCLYAAMQPLGFKSNASVTIGNDYLKQANSKNFHHVFPKAYLKKQGISLEAANNIINIVIIDAHTNKNEIRAKSPYDYLKKYGEGNADLRKSLESHLMADFKYSGFVKDSYESFLQKRANSISQELKKRIRVQPTDTGPLPVSGNEIDPDADDAQASA